MGNEKIVITINIDGSLEVETLGFRDTTCISKIEKLINKEDIVSTIEHKNENNNLNQNLENKMNY